MLTTALGLLVFALFALAVLPVPRARRLVLTGAARFAQAALLALLGLCGTFFVRPELAPPALVTALEPVRACAIRLVPADVQLPDGAVWLAVALAAVLVAVPVLIVLELAVSLSRQWALVQTLRAELRTAAAWVDSRLSALGFATGQPPTAQEARAAAEIFRAVPPTGPAATEPTGHVLDLMT